MQNNTPKTYTAKIVPYKRRDVKTGTPKVLLENIFSEDGIQFRDHCYVTITKPIQNRLNCMRNNRTFVVELKATEIEYLRRGIEKALTLNVTDIKVLGRA